MPWNSSSWWSLKTKVALVTLSIFLASFWALELYVNRMLREDMQSMLGQQQFSTVSFMATELNADLEDRFRGLQIVADIIDPAMLEDVAQLQEFLEGRPLIRRLFSGGLVFYRRDGMAIAAVAPASARAGISYMDRDYLVGALKDGKPTVGRPVMEGTPTVPMFAMAVPVTAADGKIIGALAGFTNLGAPNFLDRIGGGRYGKTGGYLLNAPKHRMIIVATDKSRNMRPLPEPGANKLLDRYLQGYEGYGITTNAAGVEQLSASKKVPAAGWFLSLVLPTEEAFAPVQALQNRMLTATILLSLMAAALIWWMLKRQLSPVFSTMNALAAMPDTSRPQGALPVQRHDEIGQLVGGFNRLLEALQQRECALRSSQERLDMALSAAEMAIWDWSIRSGRLTFDARGAEMQGYSVDELPGHVKAWEAGVFADDLPLVKERLERHFKGETPIYEAEFRVRHKDGHWVWMQTQGKLVERDADGKPLRAAGTAVDISARKRTEAALARSEQLHRETEQMGKVGGWEFDIRSGEQAWTDETFRIHEVDPGYRPTMGKGLGFYSAASRPIIELALQRAREQGEPFDLELEIVTAKGNIRSVHVQGKADLPHSRIVGFIQDVSEAKLAEAKLRAAKAEAEKANNAKSRFLAAASHDLRQPLAAISVYVGVLKKIVPSDSAEIVANLQDCVGSLSELLTDLLDVSKLEAGVVTPKLADFSVDKLLNDLGCMHSAEANLKGLQLRWRDCGATAHTDQRILHRIVGNLMANAIRYTHRGGVLVACRRHRSKRWIEVWDTGIGIPEDQIGHVFEEFRQLGDDARNRGSGLGLAIVVKSAALLGLQIRVRSKLGRGSMFAVELPAGKGIAPPEAPASELPARALKIALVEDNVQVLQSLIFALQHAGHEVIGATNGHGLLKRLGQRIPDIVISDYRLGQGETGFDVIGSARTVFGGQLPAILITGDTDPALVRNMADRGIAVHYKPMQIESLLSFIGQAVRSKD